MMTRTVAYYKRKTTRSQDMVAEWLRNHGPRPQIEYYVDVCGGIHVDLAYPDRRLAIEVDGPCHRSWKQREEDEFRDLCLHKAGWEIVRVTNDEIDADLESVGHRVLAALRNRRQFHWERGAHRVPFVAVRDSRYN